MQELSKADYWEAEQNLLGFFKLLLEVDMRMNPDYYKKISEKQKKIRDKNNK
jgi:hypothetical protein